VAPESVPNDVRAVALDDLVEVVDGVWHGSSRAETGQHMANDPHGFFGIFCRLELGDEPGEHARDIGVGAVDEVEQVVRVPKVGVQRDDPQTVWCQRAVPSIVRPSLLSSIGVEPAIVLPK